MKIKGLKWIVTMSITLTLTGCEFFGLDMQESYEYDYKAGIPDNNVHMNAWDFIQSRLDIFSLLKDAVKYADMEETFQSEDCTYLLPTNTAFTATGNSLGYFDTHKVKVESLDEEGNPIRDEEGNIVYVDEAPISMTMYPKEQVKEFLLYHIVKGKYTFTNLPAEPTWFETFAPADTAKINMYVYKDRNPNITFNNFEGHYKNDIKPRSSNLQTARGSYIHVIDSWMHRPTKKILGIK